jgi:site-specific DNA recombinase
LYNQYFVQNIKQKEILNSQRFISYIFLTFKIMKKQVGIWIRVSTDMQVQSDSPEHHELRAKMYTELNNWEVVEVYHLEAVSGKSVMGHPEAQRMLKDMKEGRITGLIFSKLARLARNTKELLEFADKFKEYGADLISLDEKIDTSTPAGRFFYTLLAAMAEWERAEISARISASIPIRAKLGKILGGEAPFGYTYNKDKKIELDEKEAPVRKLAHELFAKHKRKRLVARLMNEMGYRTRRGGKFTDTTIDRFIKDPIVTGIRRANYTTMGKNSTMELKPKSEWVFVDAPRLISDELFETGSRILNDMARKHNKVRRPTIHLFSGIIECECGTKMYHRNKSPRYVCKGCKNKIEPSIVEQAFHAQLENFLFSDTEIQKHLNEEYQKVESKKKTFTNRKNRIRSNL